MYSIKECQITKEEAKNLLSFLPTLPDYNTWLVIISAIANYFDENTALEIILSHWTDQKPGETLSKIQKRTDNHNIGTLIHYAKKYGYSSHLRKNSIKYSKLSKKFQHDDIIFGSHIRDIQSKPLYSFNDSEFEERAGIMQFDGNNDRFETEQIILKENPFLEKERVYRFAVNNYLVNKNVNPKTGLQNSDFNLFTHKFQNVYGSIFDLADNIGNGFSFIPSHFLTKSDGFIYRTNSNWCCAELIAIDIDNTANELIDNKIHKKVDDKNYLSMSDALNIEFTQKAVMIYTTCNHTEQWNRYRIIFPLEYFETNFDRYRKSIELVLQKYNADPQCKDPSRAFYGNDNAQIILIHHGLIFEYKSGLLTNLMSFDTTDLKQISNCIVNSNQGENHDK